jgi:hypothetical protein
VAIGFLTTTEKGRIDMPCFRPVFLACLLLAPPLLAGDAATVNGTLTVGGKTFKPVHVYAVLGQNPFNREEKALDLVFSSGPLEKDQLLARQPDFASVTSLQVEITQDKTSKSGPSVISWEFNVKGQEGEPCVGMPCYVSGSRIAVFDMKTYSLQKNGRAAGKIHLDWTYGPEGKKVHLAAAIEFDAPVLGERKK